MPATVRALILRAPGTNCDGETAFAFELAGAQPRRLHVRALLDEPRQLRDYQILCIPGGFSYGDDLAAGRILGSQLQRGLAEVLGDFKQAGKLVLGICNGFQVLLNSDLLLERDEHDEPAATLTLNDSGRFEDRWVHLAHAGSPCVFLRGIERLYLPVAHAEGKFVPRDEATLRRLAEGGQLALRYATAQGVEATDYPDNPNGSIGAIAGVCDATGRVLGLMPHPERFVDPTQHPRWTREEVGPVGQGLKLFQNAVEYFR